MSSNNMMLNKTLEDMPRANNTQILALPDVIIKAACCLGVSIAAAVPGWIFLRGSFVLYLGLIIVTMIAGFLLARKFPVGPGMALGYSVLLGLILGAFSGSVAAGGGGTYIELIPQAILGTFCGAVAMLIVSATPFGRRAGRAVKLFSGIVLGFLLLSVVSVIMAIFLGTGNGWGLFGVGALGVGLCVVGVGLACWSFLIDITQTSDAIAAGVPRNYDWSLGVSISASLIWLYLEILRLLAIVSR